MAALRLVVGLGNPGRQYSRTRHNAGFIVLDALAERYDLADQWKMKDGARQIVDRTRAIVLVEPQSFMNLSGEPTGRIATWHKVPAEHVLVAVDDLDLPFGRLRLRERGGSGGHNGLKSLIAHLGDGFPRLRIGIGRDSSGAAIDRVLGTFSPPEEAALEAIIDAALGAIELWLTEPAVTAVNFANSWTAGL